MDYSKININRLIFIGWLITQLFYLIWYCHYGYIFGKSDIENYLAMKYLTLHGYDLRHILIQTYIKVLPEYMLVVLIPLIYWFGIVVPIKILADNKTLFCFIFGTTSIGLFFIVGLWSQFLSIAFYLWFVFFIKYREYILATVCLILCLTYLPIFYYFIVMLLDISYGIIITMFLMGIDKNMFSYQEWNILYMLAFYICPIIWYKLLFNKDYFDNTKKSKFFIFSLTRLSRGVIFMFPFLSVSTNNKEKILIILWWLFSTGWILYGFYLEAVCTDLRYCRMYHYGFL